MSTVQNKRRMRLLIIIIAALVAVSSVLGIGLRVPEELAERITFSVDETDTVIATVVGDDQQRDIEFFIQSPKKGLQVSLGNGWGSYVKRVYEIDAYEELEIEMKFKGALEEDWFWGTYGFMYDDGTNSDFGFEQVTEDAFEARVKCYGCDTDDEEIDDVQNEDSSSGGGGGGGGGAALLEYLTESPEETQDTQNTPTNTQDKDVSTQDIAGEGAGVDNMVVSGNEQKKVSTPAFLSNSGGDAVKPEEGKLLLMAIMVLLVIFMGFASLTYKAVKEAENI